MQYNVKVEVYQYIRSTKYQLPIWQNLQYRKSVFFEIVQKVMLNQVLQSEVYLLSKIVKLFSSLAGGIKFTKLDLSHAYQQLVLEEESAVLATITTHKGLYKYLLASLLHQFCFNESWKVCFVMCLLSAYT